MTAPAIYTSIPTDDELTASLATGVPITDPHPSILRRILSALRPIRMLAGRFITPEQYGAVGDGVADDTTALQQAFAALVNGATLYLGPGRTYNHSTQLQSPTGVSGYTIAGSGTLFATNLNNSALRIRGDNVTLQGFRKQKGSTTRTDPYESQNIVCDGNKNLTVIGVETVGGSATGFFFTRLDGFRLIGLRVINTLHDSIHITGGSKNGRVIDPRVWDAGDDGVAVVSYITGSDSGMCRNIEIVNPVVLGSKAGRGVTVVGGEDVRIFNITTDDTFGAGVYIASETYGGMGIYAVARVLVSGGTIRRANRNTDPLNPDRGTVDHGAVLISAQMPGYTNTDVTVEGLDIYDTRPTAPWEISVQAGGGANLNILIRDMNMHNVVGNTWYMGAWNGGTNTNVVRNLPWNIYTASQLATAA